MSELTFPTAPSNEQPPRLKNISSGSFWPEIDLDHLRQAARIDTTITPERLHHTAIEAVAYVNAQLSELMHLRPHLARADDLTINGESIRHHRYRRAVYCYTKALLLEAYADYDATGKTAERAAAKQEQAEDYRREGHHAIAWLLGRRRIDAELL